MLISSLPHKYLPRSLPLQGPDYQVTVGKNRAGADRRITKSGDTIRVQSTNPANQLTVQLEPGGLTYANDGHLPTEVYKRADQVAVRRPSGQSVVFSHFGNEIMVNRPGLSQDVYFTKTEDGLTIDRYGYNNDVEIKSSPEGVSFRYGDPTKNTLVGLTPGIEFDPVAFQEETTLDPHALALLDKWFETGNIQPTDLVTLTQKGEILEADGLLR
jgi:hypothetical protein